MPFLPYPHNPRPSYIDPIPLRNITKPQSRKQILFPTSIKGRRRHFQVDPSLTLPKPCNHSEPEAFLATPKLLTIPALESLDTLGEKYPLSDIDFLHFPLLIHVSLFLTQPLIIALPLS